MNTTEQARVRTTIMVLPELWRKVQDVAQEERASARWVIEKAVEEFLARREASAEMSRQKITETK